MGDRCTGHCCRDFTLDLSPDQVAAFPLLVDDDGKPRLSLHGEPIQATDGDQIREMLVYLGRYTSEPGVMRDGVSAIERYHYTCKNHDGKNCTIYSTRPSMCRDYPYNDRCEYAACEWTAGREGWVDRNGEVRRPEKLKVYRAR